MGKSTLKRLLRDEKEYFLSVLTSTSELKGFTKFGLVFISVIFLFFDLYFLCSVCFNRVGGYL